MKKLLTILIVGVSLGLFGCGDPHPNPSALNMGDKVRVKGTQIEGRAWNDCYRLNSWCEISHTHGKLMVPLTQLEKLEE